MVRGEGQRERTWHQEPEQRPAGGSWESEHGAHGIRGRLRNAGAASLDLIHYTRRAKARVVRPSTPVYLSPSLSARRAVWMRSRATL